MELLDNNIVKMDSNERECSCPIFLINHCWCLRTDDVGRKANSVKDIRAVFFFFVSAFVKFLTLSFDDPIRERRNQHPNISIHIPQTLL